MVNTVVTQHTILKDGDREVLRRIAGQPQTELLVGAFWNNDLLTNLLEFWHPRGSKMAVLKHHPSALFDGLVYHISSNRTL